MTKKLLFLLVILPTLLFAQHTIKGTFSPAKDFEYAYLYLVTAETSLYITNADVAEDGTFKLILDKNSIPGTYRLVYAQPQNKYNFDFIVNNKEDIELKFDLEKGLTFIKSNENKLYSAYKRSLDLINKSIQNYYNTGNEDKSGYTEIFNILKNTQSEFEKASEGLIVNTFIKAKKPYIPENLEDVPTFTQHIKANYFTAIDFGNQVLQNSNFLIETILDFTIGFIDEKNANESYIENVDTVVKAIGNNPKIKYVLLQVLWNQFSIEGNEVVANYIGTKYLLEIARKNNNNELINTITYYKNASIGSSAPDFDLDIKDKNKKLQKSKLSLLKDSSIYLIFFWSTTCSHCLEEIPLLKKYIQSQRKEYIQVVAVALDDELQRWKDMTVDYPDFIHVFGEGKWDNPIGNQYNVTGTPSYFILNKDKKIISKPYDIDEFNKQFNSILETKK